LTECGLTGTHFEKQSVLERATERERERERLKESHRDKERTLNPVPRKPKPVWQGQTPKPFNLKMVYELVQRFRQNFEPNTGLQNCVISASVLETF